MCSVSFWIYSMSRRETSVAKEQLDKAVLEKYKTEKSCDRIISELSPNEVRLSYKRSSGSFLAGPGWLNELGSWII